MGSDLETNIQWYKGEENAIVYTSDPTIMKRLQKNSSSKVIQTHLDEKGLVTGMEFEVPMSLVKIRAGKRTASPEQIARLAKARQKKSAA